MNRESQTIFDKNVIEFVTVSAEFCKLIETSAQMDRAEFVETTLKLLPLLYLKASMVPECELMGDGYLESFVTEEMYEDIRGNLSNLLADRDAYMDVFVEDMKYSDQPITKFISEDLSDIYQVVRNFVFVFGQGLNETMHDSLVNCVEDFKAYWGQTLVNTMRPLHESRYSYSENEIEQDDSQW